MNTPLNWLKHSQTLKVHNLFLNPMVFQLLFFFVCFYFIYFFIFFTSILQFYFSDATMNLF